MTQSLSGFHSLIRGDEHLVPNFNRGQIQIQVGSERILWPTPEVSRSCNILSFQPLHLFWFSEGIEHSSQLR